MKQTNILLPCVNDSQRSYTSKVQLQYDEPLYNQVVGRFMVDGIFAPVNSKVYRKNREITKTSFLVNIFCQSLLPFVISRFQCGAFSLPREWLNISNDLPNLIINEEWHILYILWVFTLSLCCLRNKYSIIQLKALVKNNSYKCWALTANLIAVRLPYLPLHAVHLPTEVSVRTDQRATSKYFNLISAG